MTTTANGLGFVLWIALLGALLLGCPGEGDDDTGDDDVADDDTADDDDTTAGDDDDTTGPVDADGDGWNSDEDCDDSDASLNLDDADTDGYTTCDGDCDDSDGALNLDDSDGDGHDSCEGDCDDSDPALNLVDADSDGFSTCDEDCDDTDAALNLADADGDGQDTCSGDCDDTDADTYLDAPELCDGVDNDCDGSAGDEEADTDGDHHTPCGGDCDDTNADIYTGATEVCDGLDGDCDGVLPEDESDLDADGHMACDDDCDDSDPITHGGASEICDGLDNDCDGTLPWDEEDYDFDGAIHCEDCDDNNPALNLLDTDGDGYSTCDGDCNDIDASLHLDDLDLDGYTSCTGDCDDTDPGMHPEDNDGDGFAPCGGDCDDTDPVMNPVDADLDGYSPCDGDCDDTDIAVRPGQSEFCDGADNNCDGILPWDEYDSDGDGFRICEGDCDDTRAEVNPDATEQCDGALDNNCDGVNDVLEVDDDGDGTTECEGDCNDYNTALNGLDVDGDGYSTCEDDCDDNEPLVSPGEVEVCNDWLDNDCDGTDNGCGYWGVVAATSADAKLIGESAGDLAGYAVASAGDHNGDGYDDVLVGAYEADTGWGGEGITYVVLGPVSGDVDLSSAAVIIEGASSGDRSGIAVASGDVDDDGYDDVLIGAYVESAGGASAGAAYLVYGPASGTVSLTAADAKFVGEESGDYAGVSVSSGGDVNGDGFEDILVGARRNDTGGENSGAVYLVYGPVYGTVDLANADAKFVGNSAGDNAGRDRCVALDGDIDGDGLADILVGAPGEWNYNAPGIVHTVFGPAGGQIHLGADDVTLQGEGSGSEAGMVAMGDVDGDGYDDVLVGGPVHYGTGDESGVAYLMYGPLTADTDLVNADSRVYGEVAGDLLGDSVAIVGDVNGDGVRDIAFGAPGNDAAGMDAGAAYLYYGPVVGHLAVTTADAQLTGENADDSFSYIAGAGDLDDDGYDDVIVGAPYNDAGGTSAGAAYIFLGKGM